MTMTFTIIVVDRETDDLDIEIWWPGLQHFCGCLRLSCVFGAHSGTVVGSDYWIMTMIDIIIVKKKNNDRILKFGVLFHSICVAALRLSCVFSIHFSTVVTYDWWIMTMIVIQTLSTENNDMDTENWCSVSSYFCSCLRLSCVFFGIHSGTVIIIIVNKQTMT